MNLDLGILWIEDSFSAAEEEELKRRVRDAGFIARIESIRNGAEINELAKNHKLYHLYDLILLDYRLDGENGDDLARRVRPLFPSTTILFYSGSAAEDELRLLIASKNVEGVYCVARERFIERAGELIEQTARSLERLSGMRGLAMKVVAECDDLMKSAILSMTARDPNCASKLAELDRDVVEFVEEMKRRYEESPDGDLAARLGTRAVDSAKLFKHFRRLTKVAAAAPQTFGLSSEQTERLRELRKLSARYESLVLRRRNILGHVVEVKGEAGWMLQGSEEISVADFAEVRRSFAVHIDSLREITLLVTTLDGKKSD